MLPRGPLHYTKFTSKFLTMGMTPLPRMNNVQTRHSKQGGFYVFHTETCEAWPYYDTFLLKNGVFIIIFSMFHKMENTIIKIQTA